MNCWVTDGDYDDETAAAAESSTDVSAPRPTSPHCSLLKSSSTDNAAINEAVDEPEPTVELQQQENPLLAPPERSTSESETSETATENTWFRDSKVRGMTVEKRLRWLQEEKLLPEMLDCRDPVTKINRLSGISMTHFVRVGSLLVDWVDTETVG